MSVAPSTTPGSYHTSADVGLADGARTSNLYQTPQRTSTSLYPETPRSITPSPMFKRSSFMDAIVDSRPAIDHDNLPANHTSPSRARSARIAARVPLPQAPAVPSPSTDSSQSRTASTDKEYLPTPPQGLPASQVAETPRRGRRLAQVDMGWESPVFKDHIPPHSRSLIAISDPAKASTVIADNDTESPAAVTSGYASLVDRQTWASIAVIATERSAIEKPVRGPSPSPTDTRPGAQIDYLAPFRIDTPPREMQLVPVTVNTMGRIAVHESLASQIASLSALPQDQQDFQTPLLSSGNQAHLSSEGSTGGRSTTSASTLSNPTSVTTPGMSHPSPSFSLCSQFPASEASTSPLAEGTRAHRILSAAVAAKSNASSPAQVKKLSQLQALLEKASPSKGYDGNKRLRLEDDESYSKRLKPSLRGNASDVRTHLPSLDWPDRDTGPWCEASKAIVRRREDRLKDVHNWLADEAEEGVQDGAADGEAFAQQHPMVAKVLLDRVRRHAQAQRDAAWGVMATPSSIRTPRKRSAKRKGSTSATPTRSRSAKSRKVTSSSKKGSAKSKRTGDIVLETATSCLCGLGDDVAAMVQCDACNGWYHLPCVGIRDVNDLGNEWFCTTCFQNPFRQKNYAASSPVYSINTASLTSTTPSSTARYPRDELLPVFVPAGSPLHSRVSSALALAPSPPINSPGRFGADNSDLARGRSRASRVGWHLADPASPLDRKSSPGGRLRTTGPSPYVRPVTVTTAAGAKLTGTSLYDGPPRVTPGGRSRSEWDRTPTRGLAPSPSMGQSSLRASAGSKGKVKSKAHRTPSTLATVRGDSSDEGEGAEDSILSTPSRLPKNSSWGYLTNASASQTPSRSRTPQPHARDALASGWGLPSTLRTPSRDLLSSAFNADTSAAYSGGLPSLVFSSGGLDVDDFHHSRAWQLQSPTSSTRAALAKHSVGGGPLAAQLRTPELLPTWHHSATSSVRGARRLAPSSSSRSTTTNQRNVSRSLRGPLRDSDRTPEAEATARHPQDSSPSSSHAALASSSPFPATPTFETRELGSSLRIPSEDTYEEEKRRRGTVPSSGRALAKIAGEDAAAFGVSPRVPSHAIGLGQKRTEARALGIEMELDEVLQWSQ